MNQLAAKGPRGLVVPGRVVVIVLIVAGLLVLFFWWVWLPRLARDLEVPPEPTTESRSPTRSDPGSGPQPAGGKP